MRCGPIFVATSGSDANIGTIDSPMRTIGAAILAARAHTPTRDVYIANIANGVYEGTTVLAEGVNLYGGYAADWSRSLESRAIIHLGPSAPGDVALLAVNVNQPTVVDHLILEADRDPTGQSPGTTNAAALVRESAATITFTNCTLRALDGTEALDGASRPLPMARVVGEAQEAEGAPTWGAFAPPCLRPATGGDPVDPERGRSSTWRD
jgi:hypothetical protein